MAQKLDLSGRRLTGDALPIVDNIGLNTTDYSAFSVSQGASAPRPRAVTPGEQRSAFEQAVSGELLPLLLWFA